MRFFRRPKLPLIVAIALLVSATASGWCLGLCALTQSQAVLPKHACCPTPEKDKNCDACTAQAVLTAKSVSMERAAVFGALPMPAVLSQGWTLEIGSAAVVTDVAPGFAPPTFDATDPPWDAVAPRGPPVASSA